MNTKAVKGEVIFVDSENDLNKLPREYVYRADMILCGDKVLKNRWGKHGIIMEPYHQVLQENSYRILFDIFNEIKGGKKIEVE